jgi:hypothetical protein
MLEVKFHSVKKLYFNTVTLYHCYNKKFRESKPLVGNLIPRHKQVHRNSNIYIWALIKYDHPVGECTKRVWNHQGFNT